MPSFKKQGESQTLLDVALPLTQDGIAMIKSLYNVYSYSYSDTILSNIVILTSTLYYQ